MLSTKTTEFLNFLVNLLDLNLKVSIPLDLTNNLALTILFCGSNSNLSCIDVSDPDIAASLWTVEGGNIDDGMSFATTCNLPGCNDPYADNYNPDATSNNGSCSYNSDFEDDYTYLGNFDNSSYYKSNFIGLNWEEASAHAFNNGGHLATITSQLENDSVSSWITEESIFGLYQNLNIIIMIKIFIILYMIKKKLIFCIININQQ